MNCVHREQLFAYAHRLLEAREEAEVRAHVSACAACRATLEDYQKLDAVLDEWKPREPSPWFDARVRAAVISSLPAGKPSLFPGGQWARWLAPAFVVVLVAVTSVVMLRVRRPHEVVQPSVREETTKTPQAVPAAAPKVQAEAKPHFKIFKEATGSGLAKAEREAVAEPSPAMALNMGAPAARVAASDVLARPNEAVASEEDELSLLKDLAVLEDYDLLANFDVLSDVPRGERKVGN